MDKLVAHGGNILTGHIPVSGAKNAVLPIMTAAILAPGKYTIRNVPNLRDTRTMSKLIEIIGGTVKLDSGTMELDTSGVNNPEAPYDLVKTMRASFYVLGPLLARFGEARVSLPGGCAWGPRPVDLHLRGMEALGANIELDSGYIIARGDQLTGAEFTMDISSVGATGNTMMAAVLADGVTTIENAAREPEIAALGRFLNEMGADISGIGTDVLEVRGVNDLHPTDFTVIPDRIEAGTYLVAGAMIGENLEISPVVPKHMKAIIEKVRNAGAIVKISDEKITVTRADKIQGIDITTAIFPGYPTDMQAQWMAFMATADGSAVITEEIYQDRFTHVAELNRLGANISLEGNVAVVKGVNSLKGAPVMSTDIRASASLILAALVAEGRSDIQRIYHIDRGYEQIEKKLQGIGADIVRESA
ncbi:MAG: UDP-N-acetylglucosamine 1-carboxyvinyltransferase [Candidatus Marinimicrobia bacterium]|nr:UDP-N-acetylglucosamine 1-carboxyvinyltransferase [Candidatus Neomarinimicrobiota bacterium]MCF7880281.1 UDP-N-acetylglucosamine 1-carboxyvinyltransferase [Candidatus Neomarinimicrobiota bacterium]